MLNNLMAVFTVKDLFFNYQDKELYNNLSFQLNPNEHACLVHPGVLSLG